MPLRDGIYFVMGAAVSFGLGLLATTHDPSTVLRWGFGASLFVLALLIAIDLLRGAWLSVTIVPFAQLQTGTHLRIEFRNHGMRNYGTSLVNIAAPDASGGHAVRTPGGLRFWDCDSTGEIADDQTELIHIHESIDGGKTEYVVSWGKKVEWSVGTQIAMLLITTAETVPLRVQVAASHKTQDVDFSRYGTEYRYEFGGFLSLRPRVQRAYIKLKKKITKKGY
jgi:hypothetical protein